MYCIIEKLGRMYVNRSLKPVLLINRNHPVPGCIGLKKEWVRKMKATIQFPVNPGTVVEVTCLHSDAINEGSSEVTCITGRLYSFSTEPICSIPGYCYKFYHRSLVVNYTLPKFDRVCNASIYVCTY